jgi:hypothetical protein
MALPVVTVASGGLPVADNTSGSKIGMPITEAANGYGIAVTKVAGGSSGMATVYVSPTGGPVTAPTTFNPADLLNVTLSNGNLTATAVTGQTNAGVRGVGSISSGKYYWECKYIGIANNGMGIGAATASANLATMGTTMAQTVLMTRLGNIFINNVNSGVSLSTRAVNDVVAIAVDMIGKLVWFRVTPSGNWNNNGTADPAGGTGGLSISALTGPLYPFFLPGFPTNSGDVITMNSGGSAFNGVVPAGFTAGFLV